LAFVVVVVVVVDGDVDGGGVAIENCLRGRI